MENIDWFYYFFYFLSLFSEHTEGNNFLKEFFTSFLNPITFSLTMLDVDKSFPESMVLDNHFRKFLKLYLLGRSKEKEEVSYKFNYIS